MNVPLASSLCLAASHQDEVFACVLLHFLLLTGGVACLREVDKMSAADVCCCTVVLGILLF